MIVKVHKGPDGRKVVALCDESLIGHKYEDNGLQLDLCSSFYKGERKSEKETLECIKDAHVLNIVGSVSIELALRERIIEKKNVIIIGGIPHAQAIMD